MTKTVTDNALLLEVIAGPDGHDDRQPPSIPAKALTYSSSVTNFLSENTGDKPLSGFKIGVLKEGFCLPTMDNNVATAVRSAIADLATLGAEVVEVSVTSHFDISTAWMCTLPYAGGRDGLHGDRTGRKEFFHTDRAAGPNPSVSQEQFDAWGAGAQNLYMRYLYMSNTYGTSVHAKVANLIRRYTQDYDAALASVDALVMPTLPIPATKSFAQEDPEAGPLKRLQYMAGVLLNTAPFDSTGHPALSFPVGFVPALDDGKLKLPTGMQIVGRNFDDLTCLKIAAAWERAKDWKTLSFGI
jgi:amidase